MQDRAAPPSAREADASPIEALAASLGPSRAALERMQALRECVHDTLNSEFALVADDLEQLRRILSDAAGKLSGTFRVMTVSSDDLRRTLAQMPASADLPALHALGRIAAEMSSTSGTTVQSLQFDDMAQQLLQHVDRKLAILARLTKDMAVPSPGDERGAAPARPERVDTLFELLERYRAELTVATRKVVQQQSLDSGDIELF